MMVVVMIMIMMMKRVEDRAGCDCTLMRNSKVSKTWEEFPILPSSLTHSSPSIKLFYLSLSLPLSLSLSLPLSFWSHFAMSVFVWPPATNSVFSSLLGSAASRGQLLMRASIHLRPRHHCHKQKRNKQTKQTRKSPHVLTKAPAKAFMNMVLIIECWNVGLYNSMPSLRWKSLKT